MEGQGKGLGQKSGNHGECAASCAAIAGSAGEIGAAGPGRTV